MENIRFDFSDFHRHGRAFYEFLELRKKVFVDQLKWDVPHNDAVEMDQYDTPVAHYSLVLRDGVVIGGARTMATTATWGEHTYMLRDAYSGKLPHIPPHIMSVDIATPKVWECTRLVVSNDLVTQADRVECMRLIVDGLVDLVKLHGAEELICLSSLHLMRVLRQIGYDVTRLGDTYRNDEDGRQYGVLRMPAEYSNAHRAQLDRIATTTPLVPKRRPPVDFFQAKARPPVLVEAVA
jgi:N-acyl-L-homoserine lactone synthetase